MGAVTSCSANPGSPHVACFLPYRTCSGCDPDFLVFVAKAYSSAQRFDLASGRIAGEPFPVASPVAYNYSTGRGEFATSRTGHIVYQSNADSERLAWSDRRGVTSGEVGSRGNYQSVRLSPDDGRVLFDRLDAQLGTPDVWVLDMARGIETRITAQATSESFPVWLKGGLGTVFMADRDGPPRLVRADLVKGGDEALLPTGRMQQPVDVSPDGRTLAFQQRTPLGNFDVVMMSLDAAGSADSSARFPLRRDPAASLTRWPRRGVPLRRIRAIRSVRRTVASPDATNPRVGPGGKPSAVEPPTAGVLYLSAAGR